eukprot:CAMPEP_0202880224 /NCGR_PEP_ID=MMETSP1391-20130828/34800_1 /ASSEMBLY_ACC=CAM_ASM_000867 /TAXON_ID=1034604 /ORGANISM="Chlamydomonas leiostraca, Strain SAG 11-49" /LENGTH=62 /DNA_ID=CAMNT_0049562699 /DNA_START=223 /DNA_END=408 /DNA_ORIENTATION=-
MKSLELCMMFSDATTSKMMEPGPFISKIANTVSLDLSNWEINSNTFKDCCKMVRIDGASVEN